MSQEGRQLFNQSYKFQCRLYLTIAGEVKHHRDATDDAGPVDENLFVDHDQTPRDPADTFKALQHQPFTSLTRGPHPC